MSSLKFGTSGLRGLVTDLVGWPSFSYASAFLRFLSSSAPRIGRREVLIGRDLRASSPAIAGACAGAAAAEGWIPVDCGALPTPALALEALARGAPAIMVTGSHIPDDRNGLKFYTAQGEITKADEAGILAALSGLAPPSGPIPPASAPAGAEIDGTAIERYRRRYIDVFAPGCLSGLSIGVYQHSTVARDILPSIVEALGGRVLRFGASTDFVPIDTEAYRPEDIALLAAFAAEHGVDAIVSADGDADRPLIADAGGRVVRGDIVGLMTALALPVETIVTPVTSCSAIERIAAPASVVRTRVGSPFVIAAIEEAVAAGRRGVVGFEANGGVLLGTAVVLGESTLTALATRDALLPILCVLSALGKAGRPLSEIVASLGAGSTGAGRLPNTPSAASAALLAAIGGDRSFADLYFRDLGSIVGMDTLDGVRTTLSDGGLVHYRASGNAPELRCYVEAPSETAAADLLDWGLDRARRFIATVAR